MAFAAHDFDVGDTPVFNIGTPLLLRVRIGCRLWRNIRIARGLVHRRRSDASRQCSKRHDASGGGEGAESYFHERLQSKNKGTTSVLSVATTSGTALSMTTPARNNVPGCMQKWSVNRASGSIHERRRTTDSPARRLGSSPIRCLNACPSTRSRLRPAPLAGTPSRH